MTKSHLIEITMVFDVVNVCDDDWDVDPVLFMSMYTIQYILVADHGGILRSESS